MKTVLITGGSGFLGINLARFLRARGVDSALTATMVCAHTAAENRAAHTTIAILLSIFIILLLSFIL